MPDYRYIAIVDDHTMFRKGLCALIDLFPRYRVLFDAANGKDFINRLHPGQLPDIVLLDIKMPEMDGFETARWINAHYPDMKILALSTMDADTVIIKMIRSGAKGYVLKDADPKELNLAFDEVLAKGYFYNDQLSRKILQSISGLTDEKNMLGTLVKLTDRELQFLKLACSEKSYQQIAGEMFLSERTVDGYRESLFKKLGVNTRVGLVIYAIKNNMVQL
ncbi:two component transcriptional regulator, LuxR family [Chitinophaga rupis]|uniref:Two component transcriptional regulator, LuxR family n=1 Tax=Chitinophaga rupis TaxID=573321 RepID=A0A1H8A1J9_9BACT|nr:response regulator transcription factor [Chitinophaga rupis]SEM64376.1 two component transcriptional regulator, LuxR family [Chitinophaga rupis]